MLLYHSWQKMGCGRRHKDRGRKEEEKEKGNEGGQRPPVSDKGPLPPYCLSFRKPPPGSRVVSRYSCLSVSSFRKRECEQERNRQRERGRDRKTDGEGENGTMAQTERRGFYRRTGEKQQQQVQLEKETMCLR